jgi:phospholipase/lecithinase/hemolysin
MMIMMMMIMMMMTMMSGVGCTHVGLKRDFLTVCCGGSGRYHYNLSVACGDEAATVCEDPSKSLFWDGVHLTEAPYHYIAKDWLSTILSSVSASGAATTMAYASI